jgi:hypothetical protein
MIDSFYASKHVVMFSALLKDEYLRNCTCILLVECCELVNQELDGVRKTQTLAVWS